MKTNYVVVALVIVVLVLLGVALSKNKSGTPISTTPPPATSSSSSTGENAMMSDKAVVYYSERGFDPQVIFVKKGTKVEFVNNTNDAMFVASNNHPTHELLAGFSQEASLGKGDVYEFSFTEEGLWGYHNHNNSKHVGAIVVRE